MQSLRRCSHPSSFNSGPQLSLIYFDMPWIVLRIRFTTVVYFLCRWRPLHCFTASHKSGGTAVAPITASTVSFASSYATGSTLRHLHNCGAGSRQSRGEQHEKQTLLKMDSCCGLENRDYGRRDPSR
jgi:hypothetical protein